MNPRFAPLLALGLAFLLAVPAAPLLAQAPTAPESAPQAALSPKAMVLLETVSPRTEFEQQFSQAFLGSFNQALAKDSGLTALEAAKPGLTEALRAAVSAELSRQIAEEYRHFSGALGHVYQDALTEPEMDEVIAFYRSPAGQRMMTRMKAAAQTSVAQMQQNGEAGDVQGTLQSVTSSALAAGIQGLSAEDLQAVTAFSTRPAGLKMAQTQGRIMAVTTEQTQAMVARLSAKFQPVIQQVMARYLSQD